MEKQRAVAYIRVSGERQVTEGSSLTTQETTVKSYAMQRGYLLLKVFIEAGQSAKTDQRPVLKDMLAYCKARRSALEVVIFPKVDRFARYHRDYSNLKHDLRLLGIRLESVSEGFNDTPAGRFMENMLAASAQYDNEVRAERAQGGLLQAAQDGRWVWLPPPGYERVRVFGKITIQPSKTQAPLIVETFERLAKRQARPNDIRLWLWSNGIQLGRATFYRLIQNPVYLGVVDFHDQRFQGVPPFVGIVSQSLFDAARAALRQKRTPHRYERDNPDFPLRGTVRCSCGRFLTACWSRGKTKRFPYYRCTACQGVNLQRLLVERWFASCLSTLSPSLARQEQLKQRAMASWQTQSSTVEEQNERITKKTAAFRRIQQSLALKNAKGIVPDEIAKAQIQELQTKIEELEGDRFVVSQLPDDPRAIVDFVLQFLANPGSYWQHVSLVNQKRLQNFYFPTGLTYHGETNFRTPSDGPFAGWRHMFGSDLSREAGTQFKTPNFRARKPRKSDSAAEIANMFLRMYNELGPESDESKKAA